MLATIIALITTFHLKNLSIYITERWGGEDATIEPFKRKRQLTNLARTKLER